VILLNSGGPANVITARLFEPINQRSPYLALSHCWGTHQNCITTQDNLPSRKADIPWVAIPQTFREVMQLAVKLGFRYIWIDSLCIVQDDAEDWEIQSSLMSEIYQHAVLTLAATSSTGDNVGCYTRNKHQIPDLEITLPDDIGACNIAVRKPLNHFDTQNAKGLLDRFPLLTRGWAFQERLLSSRVLHICESELVWECREKTSCECGGLAQDKSPGGTYHHAVKMNEEEKRQHSIAQQEMNALIEATQRAQIEAARLVTESFFEPPPAYDGVVSTTTTESSIPFNTQFRLPTPNEGTNTISDYSNIPVYQDAELVNETDIKDCPDLVFHFHRIVEQYSALKLSRPSDRLAAFSGLCKRVAHLRNNYLAGLWSDSVGYDLLWRVNTINLDTDQRGARSADYRGPTWSWVSVDSSVTYWSDIINFRITYEGFPTHLAGHTQILDRYYGFKANEVRTFSTYLSTMHRLIPHATT
jgi:hypothetical protein